MTKKEWALYYATLGWYSIVLIKFEKECRDKDWMKKVYDGDDFDENVNLGLRLVSASDKERGIKLVDIDCDAPEVVQCISAFMLDTPAVYGRASKPKSHWLYDSEFEKGLAFKDEGTVGGTLIEIRVNHQSMAPPSVHPSGELLKWEGGKPKEAAKVDPADLLRATRLTATCALTIRYYNPPGDRHDWGMALSGFLKQLSITKDESDLIFTESAKYVKDHLVKDRLDANRSTHAKTDDDPITSARQLRELMKEGDAFVKSLNKIWAVEQGITKGVMERLNDKHCLIFQQNGEVALMTEEEEDGRPQLRFSHPKTMLTLYPEAVTYGFTTTNQPKQKKLGQLWLDSRKRRFYRGIELCPNGAKANEGYYNLWKGFSVEPKKGDWSLYGKHILEVLACNNVVHADYIVTWLSQCVQHPEQQGFTALVLRGGQGVGKSTFAEWFGSLFGSHFLEVNSSNQLTGRFNAHFHNTIFLFADEAAWPGDRAGAGSLRRMVTQDTLAIEKKGVDILTVKNHIHLMLASNSNWVVPAGIDERRFACFDLSIKHRNDAAWFKAMHKQLFEDGGLAAMLYDLLEYKSEVDLRKIPKTRALGDQKVESFDYIHTWWHDKLCTGNLLEGGWPKKVQYAALHEDYCIATDKHFRSQRSRKHTQTEMGRFLFKYAPGDKQRTMEGGIRNIFREMPNLAECRAIWTMEIGYDFQEDDQ